MTRRERLEAKAERRREWSGKASSRSAQRFGATSKIADGIPVGQPILVGHHSEGHARRDAERIHSNMSKGVEEQRLAEHHAAKASGLEIQLERSVFTDDADAIEQLQARIATNEAKAAKYAEINKAWRKGGAAAMETLTKSTIEDVPVLGAALAATIAETMRVCPYLKVPLDTTNLRARIRSDKERITEIERQRAHTEKATAAGGVLVEGGEWVRVTFEEKPARAVLEALRMAGFHWGAGSWGGRREALPAEVIAMVSRS